MVIMEPLNVLILPYSAKPIILIAQINAQAKDIVIEEDVFVKLVGMEQKIVAVKEDQNHV